ncbi:MAG: DUF429 domain-containing protein [Gammaproteobacteria bacterium]|nr:DUF429 domain-containing protein [Gammaproteobacteria bacterium]
MQVRVRGIDFTSRPKRSKPITLAECELSDGKLTFLRLQALASFSDFEAALEEPGHWIAGIDFPFGQSRKFVENIGWPLDWIEYVKVVERMGRSDFREQLESYRRDRLAGDKEHRRRTDSAAGSISPQKLYGVPVGLMFFEGAPRIAASTATIPGLKAGDPDHVVVESYPGVLARSLVGRRGYKTDTKSKQSPAHHSARQDILESLRSRGFAEQYGFAVEAPPELADDPSGDELDALLVRYRQHGLGQNATRTSGCRRSSTLSKVGYLTPI